MATEIVMTWSRLETLFILFIQDSDVKRQLQIALKKLLFWTMDRNSTHSEVFQTVILKILTDFSMYPLLMITCHPSFYITKQE